MKKKIKKFGRGGDIVTGIGAALIGKALYDRHIKGDSKDDSSGASLKRPAISEEVEKAQSASKKEKPREKYEPVGNEGKEDIFKEMPKYVKRGPPAQDVSGKKKNNKKDDKKDDKKDSNVILPETDTYRGATKPSAAHAAEVKKIFKDVDDPNKGKYKTQRAPSTGMLPGKNAYKDSSGTIYNERGEPFANPKTVTTPSNPTKRGAGRSRYPASTETSKPPKKGAGRSRYTTTTSETAPKEDKRSSGTAATLAGTGAALGTAALLGGMRKAERARKDREMSRGREERSSRSPVRNISPEEAAFENEGGRYYKKGGKIKKFAAGGTTTSKPEPKKAPMPDFARQAKENRERDQRVKKEREAYDKYDKTRLKDQGSFKKGGMASSRGDGIAMRGKTKGRVI